jgi:hypothetical protein
MLDSTGTDQRRLSDLLCNRSSRFLARAIFLLSILQIDPTSNLAPIKISLRTHSTYHEPTDNSTFKCYQPFGAARWGASHSVIRLTHARMTVVMSVKKGMFCRVC